MEEERGQKRAGVRWGKGWAWAAGLAAAAALCAWGLGGGRGAAAAEWVRTAWRGIEAWAAGTGVWGPVAVGVAVTLATLLFLPTTVPLLAAGALFGVGTGLVTGWIGLGVGMSVAYWLARGVLRERLRKRYGDSALLKKTDEALEREGWKYVMTLRMMPITPFPLLNYLFGLTKIRYRTYILSSLAGLSPEMVLYVLLGDAAGTAAAGGAGSGKTVAWLFAAAALFALAVFGGPRLWRRLRGKGKSPQA